MFACNKFCLKNSQVDAQGDLLCLDIKGHLFLTQILLLSRILIKI